MADARGLILPNRRDVSRRTAPHDLAVSASSGFKSPFGQPCFPCGDCKKGGMVTGCAHCLSANKQYAFTFPSLSSIIADATASLGTMVVEWASSCTWESDDIAVACSGGTDQFGFALEFAGKNPGDVALTCSRRSGSGCNDVEFTYRNFYPVRCLCPMLMFLDAESAQDIDADDLPCSLCIHPTYSTCGGILGPCGCPDNWRTTIDGEVIESTSGPYTSPLVVGTEYCSWWTVSPIGGLYTLFVTAMDVDVQGAFESHYMAVTQYSTPPMSNFPNPFSINPFVGGTRVADWNNIAGNNGSFCAAGCYDGATLTNRFGGGHQTTLLVEHLNG